MLGLQRLPALRLFFTFREPDRLRTVIRHRQRQRLERVFHSGAGCRQLLEIALLLGFLIC
ncbi:hypothetical protein D3C76_1725540 [compost metagenome]